MGERHLLLTRQRSLGVISYLTVTSQSVGRQPMTQHPETSSLSADLGTEWLESEYRGTIVCKICTQVLRRLALLRCKLIAVMKT